MFFNLFTQGIFFNSIDSKSSEIYKISSFFQRASTSFGFQASTVFHSFSISFLKIFKFFLKILSILYFQLQDSSVGLFFR
jgi:hypothetical protein